MMIETYQENKVPGHGSITDLDKKRRRKKGKARNGGRSRDKYEMRTKGISDMATFIQTQDPNRC